MVIALSLLVLGLVILILGAEGLVRGASSLAKKLGISSLVIGLTIVAFGTSAPELVVNIFSALEGSADIAIGNIIGSNIANILLILGISALITPLAVTSGTVWKEIPFGLLAMGLTFIMGNDALIDKVGFNAITRTDGLTLMALMAIFMYYVISIAKKGNGNHDDVKQYSTAMSVTLILGGLAALFYGGKLLVDNAIILARLAGLSESLIGLTIVAVGTSLPELATSVVAAMHKQNDIAVGNIIGSNIFNIFWILGLSSVILQLPFNPTVNIDVLVGIGATLLLFFTMFVGKRHTIEGWQGAFFIFLYVSYVGYLVVRG
ncbi:calcium/sodium antiporter [Candidatus Roizmanbacteria bacterium]|nr:calcium/sodium antiporter [Candidatus Roizmanbacteria bacterium]